MLGFRRTLLATINPATNPNAIALPTPLLPLDLVTGFSSKAAMAVTILLRLRLKFTMLLLCHYDLT